jgi:NADH-quinone oxidoreductase subunit N
MVSVFHLLNSKVQPAACFHNAVLVDSFSLTLAGICLLSGLLACFFSSSYLKLERAVTGEYYALLLMAVSGMITLVMAAEFLTLFVGLELMSLASYALAGYLRVRERSAEAALKYFMTGVFASAFLLSGMSLLYGATGSLNFQEISRYAGEGREGFFFLKWGAVLLLVGLGFKVAAVPFHAWAPDVYDGAPAPVSVLLSTGLKTAGFGALARIFTEIFGVPGGWTMILAFLAVMTMVVGNLGALAQSSVKRMLAFSSVAHAGYVLVGLSVVSLAPIVDIERAVAFYLLAYTLMTAGAFGWLAWAGRKGESLSKLEDFKGLGLAHPWMGLAMAIFLFSLAGLTPTAGFFGKYYLFKLAVDQGLIWLALVAVLNSFVSAYYYLRVAAYLYQKPTSDDSVPTIAPGFASGLAFALCLAGTILVGFLKFPF